jgi:hypothetical protein
MILSQDRQASRHFAARDMEELVRTAEHVWGRQARRVTKSEEEHLK